MIRNILMFIVIRFSYYFEGCMFLVYFVGNGGFKRLRNSFKFNIYE